MHTKRRILRIVLDVLCLILVFIPWIVLQAIGQPYRRGFYCDDESIKYPYRDDTVPNVTLTVVGIIVTFLIILFIELAHYLTDSRPNSSQLTQFRVAGRNIPYVVVAVYIIFGIFLFGMAAQQTLTNIGKYTIGRLRPHFLDVCRPDYAALNCSVMYGGTDGTHGVQLFRYVIVDDSQCTGDNLKHLKEARLSFPSGHSSFSMYVAVFVCFYLQFRLSWKGSKLLRHLGQAIFIYLAIYVCLSRISDYKHHWSDVLSGAILGAFVAALTCVHVSKSFRPQHYSVETLPTDCTTVPQLAPAC